MVLTVVVGIALTAVTTIALFVFILVAGISLSRTGSFVVLGADAYVCLTLSCWWFCLRRHHAPFSAIGLAKPRWASLAAMVPLSIALLLANGVLVIFTSAVLGGVQNPQSESLAPRGVLTTQNYVLLLVLIAIVAPLGEELIFRGMLYRFLRGKKGVTVGIVLSAAIFSLAHVVPVLLPSLFLLGIALALVTERFQSILPAIVLHALNNGISLTILYAASTRM